ncbi:MAG TPA: flagellar regulator YcgR PilZN domain-containing protein [Burkholderiaceae bacterium]|nr:flagellar regulator YcgR PilZN domain-containing protein [Burkholderiaceae bacterium]
MEGHDYDRFRVDDPAEVMALLERSARARVLCSVRAAGRAETYLSPLHSIDEGGAVELDAPRAPVIERLLVPGGTASVDLRLSDCRVSFEARVERVGHAAGGRTRIRLARPDWLMRLQRRETYRVRVPEDLPVRMTLDPADAAMVGLQLHDLSTQGGSVSVTGVRQRFGAGTVFSGGRLVLPDGTEWQLAFRVIHAAVLRRRGEGGDMRLGLQFVHPPAGFETAVGQWVGRIARRLPGEHAAA